VLVVAYYFPPIGGGGVNRTLRLVRAIAAEGWQPLVVTVDDAAWVRDPALCGAVPPAARVWRLPNPDWGRVAARPGAAAPGGAARGRLRRWLVPDLHVGWSALVAPVAALFAATRAADLLYTTCPPYSAHVAGLAARGLGLPGIADFRDAWLECPTRTDLPPWRLALERRMEEAVLRRADRVIFASDAARQRAIRRVPGLSPRAETVLTGFDPRDFAETPGIEPPPDRLELVHAGSLLLNHMGASFERFAGALARWCAGDASVRRDVRVRLVGAEPEIAARVARAGLSDWVKVEPGVPRARLPALLRGAHAALAFASEARFGGDPIPGKLFDALGAGRPLIALVPPGGLADLVRERALGVALDPRDADALLAALASLRERVARGERIEAPPRASRDALSSDLAMARIIAAMRSIARPPREERRPCPSPTPSR
jgi:glycosyltransferase involved in cell wall biosynthesis